MVETLPLNACGILQLKALTRQTGPTSHIPLTFHFPGRSPLHIGNLIPQNGCFPFSIRTLPYSFYFLPSFCPIFIPEVRGSSSLSPLRLFVDNCHRGCTSQHRLNIVDFFLAFSRSIRRTCLSFIFSFIIFVSPTGCVNRRYVHLHPSTRKPVIRFIQNCKPFVRYYTSFPFLHSL
ncbi:hypothetical protein BGX38DRAFT_363612 [Terfezia claveryi]|nr:hypothetical protein BGX38DRAFT_363612 [Terfezia claveryi]